MINYIIKHNTGFTLVELIVTIVLIGILATVGLPRFFDSSTYNKHALYQETISALRYAQKKAVATQCQVRLNITTDAAFILQQDANCNPSTASYTQDIQNPGSGNANYSVDNFAAKDVSFSANPTNSIIFDALGSSINGDTEVIIGGTLSISIVGETGFICGGAGVNGCPDLI